ncbi:hypothetical protein MTR67_018230 [Solanum verrucosum]|uniref:Uncharacterized protein n=1 Tax=Solanum verrucosum TaxID=315347 RepID=A0AAF0QLZ9_SOLVR|nr:hypothetical protein MTR67_018230 [Solanum verrucosum]
MDHSASLVGDLPFGRFHHRLALSFSIVVFWIIWRHSTASRNCSATRQLLLFTTDLIRSFRAQHTGTKGEDKTFWRFAEWVRRFLDLHFFILSVAFVPFLLTDHSASLVEIADQLGDPTFGRFHHRLALSFNIVVFWIIGQHCTTSVNFLVIRQLLIFIVDLICSFRAQHTGTKGEDKTF